MKSYQSAPLQRIDAEHPYQDGSQDHFDHGKVGEQQLTHEHIETRNLPFVQEKAKNIPIRKPPSVVH